MGNAPEPSAIFFDMDGTILDWQTGMDEMWRAACEDGCRDGGPDPITLFDAIVERRTWFWSDAERAYRGRMDLDAASREIVRAAMLDLKHDAASLADAIAMDYRARRKLAIAPYPGAIELLDSLKERGMPMALITNGNARAQRESVERFGLERYFDCIVIEGEFGCGKPDERVFRHALSAVTCDPSAAWMIGDSLEADIVTPVRLGMHAIWIDAEGAGLPEDAAEQPHRIIRAISELA